MSHLLELSGKTGHVCPKGFTRTGPCPLILRATSEDLVTATVFGILKNLRPEKWLAPWLNEAFETTEFARVTFDDLAFQLWPSLKAPPGLPHREGASKPDLMISFDSTVVLIEAKYRSPLAANTSNGQGRNQFLRFLDCLHHHHGGATLFAKRLYAMTLTTTVPEIVNRYKDPGAVARDLTSFNCSPPSAAAIANAVKVGSSTWDDLAGILAGQLEEFDDTEQAFALDVIVYLAHKLQALSAVQQPSTCP